MQAPPDVVPDGFGIVGLAALDQFGNLPPENVGNRAAIAADGIGVANAFGPVGIAEAACHELKGLDFAVCAIGEGNRQRDPVESSVDLLDPRHCLRPFSAS